MRSSFHFQSCTGRGLSPNAGRGQVTGRKGVTRGKVLVTSAGGGCINPRTFTEWEQGRKQPDAMACACLAVIALLDRLTPGGAAG